MHICHYELLLVPGLIFAVHYARLWLHTRRGGMQLVVIYLILWPTLLHAQPTTPQEAFDEIHPTGQFGVGPGFDANSCLVCHNEGGRATGGPTYRSHHWVRELGGSTRQLYRFSTVAGQYNPDGPFQLLQIVPPSLRGIALLELIPDDQIARYHDPWDSNGDGISGRVNGQCSNWAGPPCGNVGRYGVKACEITLGEAIRAALALGFGVTPAEQATYASHWDPRIDMIAALPELHTMKPPHISPGNEARWVRGEQVLAEIGCADCHTATPYTLTDGRQIKIYSDLVLHDLGLDNNDRISLCGDAAAEFRTAPLAFGKRNWMHDGIMNDSIRIDVIRRHGGEATRSANAWRAILNTEDARALDVFLFSFSPVGSGE